MKGQSRAPSVAAAILLVVAAAGAQLVSVSQPVYATGEDGQPDATLAAAARARYGLASDATTVTAVVSNPDNELEGHPGLWATPAEREELDLNGRMKFEAEVSTDVVPFVKELDEGSLAGYWFDQSAGAEFVVALTDSYPEIEDAISEKMPSPSKGLRFVVMEHSLAQLRQAASDAWDVWEEAGLAPPFSTSVRQKANGVQVTVHESDLAEARARVQELETDLGVAIDVVGVTDPHDIACDRRVCTPQSMRAGFLIFNDSQINEGRRCTAAFILHDDTWAAHMKDQILTAGHCWRVPQGDGYTWDPGGKWWNTNIDIGPTKDVSPYQHGEDILPGHDTKTIDIMRIGLNDDPTATPPHPVNYEATVYRAGNGPSGGQAMQDAIDPTEDLEVCASFGWTDDQNADGSKNGIHCGVVTNANTFWISNLGQWRVNGNIVEFDDHWSPLFGDSGSPIYHYFDFFGRYIYPVGVADTVVGDFTYFAGVKEAMDKWWDTSEVFKGP